jgi:hypothetical protein
MRSAFLPLAVLALATPALALDPSVLPRGLAVPPEAALANVPQSATYRPDPEVRERLAGIMAEGAAKEGAAQAAEMRRLVLSGEAVRQYERVAPRLGYRANDAIDGLAFYLLAQWGVANDYRPDISRAQAAAVRRQAAAAFASVADQVATDALRQEFGEMLMIQGAIIAGTHEAALRAGDQATLDRYAAMAREGGRSLFQADPVDIALTDQGFRRK